MKLKCNDTKTAFHNYYNQMLPVWEKMRDSVSSEECIKQKAWAQVHISLAGCNKISDKLPLLTFSQYLRPTEGMLTSKTGKVRYSNYLYRAKWYPYALDTHDQSLGLINNQPATIELTSGLEYLKNDATQNQESLQTVLNCIYSQQMIKSRVGIKADVTGDAIKPFNLSMFYAESITDWAIGIDNSGDEVVKWIKIKTDQCSENNKPIYLIMAIDENGFYYEYKTVNENIKYGDTVVESDVIADSYKEPKVKEKRFNKIPFVTCNLSRLGLNNIEKPWLEALADACFKAFQADADYRNGLHWNGDGVFYATGIKKEEAENIKLGAGGKAFSSSTDAKFGFAVAGMDSAEPRKIALEDLKKDCVALGVDLINQGVESGTALDTRMNVKTASLKTLANTGAEALERLLRICAEWNGENKEDVIVKANTQFSDRFYTAQELKEFGALVTMGQMSQEDFYNIQKRQKITTAETFEDWSASLESEVMTGEL